MYARQKYSLISLVFTACVMALLPLRFAHAEPRNVQGPILDPQSGSYFELNDRRDLRNDGPNWREAQAVAAAQSYKGRRGRLAVIDSREKLQFVESKFKIPGETWIGLRYFCRFRKLLWTTGESQSLQAISNLWAAKWHRTNITCASQGGEMQYMPVYITGPESGPPKFQASGIEKRFYFVLVEYPAPEQPGPSAKK